MKRVIIFSLIIAGMFFAGESIVVAQCKGDFGADKPAAELKIALYGDAVRAQKYQEARAPLHGLLTN